MSPKRTTLRLDGYVRVSKVGGREGEGFISPDVQAEAIAEWAEAQGHSVTMHEPELDVSGGTMRRPVFNQIMRRIDAGDSDGLVVFKVDRFARSLLGALTTLETIAKAGGTFASVRDNVDMTSAQGRAFLHMQLVFAELFREQVGEQFNVATQRAVERGVHIANAVPLGYDRVEQRLVPNADAAIVRELFERRASGAGASELARWLDTAVPRDNGARWTPARVRTMLGMRCYLGEAHYGQHRNRAAHPPIVSEGLFQRAAIAKSPTPATSGNPALLAGIVRCAACRYVMTPAVSKAADRAPTTVYRCRHIHTAGKCPAPTVVARDRLEQYVELAAMEALYGLEVSATEAPEVERLQSELRTAQDELDAFATDTTARTILRDRYHAAMQDRADAVVAAEQALAGAVAASAQPAIPAVQWPALTTVEKRVVLTQMLSAVFVSKAPANRRKPPIESRVMLAWRPWNGEDDLPRRGRDNGPVRPVEWITHDDHHARVAAL